MNIEIKKVSVQAHELLAVRFMEQKVWCIFRTVYIEGETVPDNGENENDILQI